MHKCKVNELTNETFSDKKYFSIFINETILKILITRFLDLLLTFLSRYFTFNIAIF